MTLFLPPTKALAQAGPVPEKTVTLADAQSVLGGKFDGRAVEPGIFKYEEIGGPRVVEIWVSLATRGAVRL